MSLSADDSRKLSHLLRRAAFGARPEEWDAYARLGIAETTRALLHPEDTPDHLADVLKEIDGDYVDFTSMDSVKMWWVYRMAHTQRPLEEKMTLFWHNHFATANYKVDNPMLMWKQNDLFRTHGLGNFRTLLQAVSRDPAMLIWLDGTENRKGKPNENYGRELLELFTLGINGGYTEQDVKEAARAFTGWHYDRLNSTFVFDADRHDDGVKTFLGETGPFNGDDIIDILVRHPSTASFICTKLFKFFMHDNPTPDEIKPFAAVYFQSAYDIRAIVQAMLTSSAFYSQDVFYAKIKSPAEFMVILIRTLNVPMAELNNIPATLRAMGQDLFLPPNVKGWPEGQAWINTVTLLTRINFASQVVSQLDKRDTLTQRVNDAMRHTGLHVNTPEFAVDALLAALLPDHPSNGKTWSTLLAYAKEGWKPGDVKFTDKAPGLVNLILSSPAYQLA